MPTGQMRGILFLTAKLQLIIKRGKIKTLKKIKPRKIRGNEEVFVHFSLSIREILVPLQPNVQFRDLKD